MAQEQTKRKRSLPDQRPESNRPKKYRKWNEESKTGPIKAVTEGKLEVNRAADQYAVPRSTLKDRLSGRHGNMSGPEPYLSFEEERELVSHLIKINMLRLDTLRLRMK